MNHLYKLPLHGLACKPYCDLESAKYSVVLESEKLDLSNKTCIWQLEDLGERYKTKIELFVDNTESNISDINLTVNKDKLNSNEITSTWCYKTLYLNVDCEGKGVFKVTPQAIKVDWLEGTEFTHYFQTLVAALWLELNNVACIHANALAYHNKAIALVAPSRTGKSTLTLSLIEHGFKLMTDDMLALHKASNKECSEKIDVFPSWPVTRMWPDSLSEMINIPLENTAKVHERFSKRIINFNTENSAAFCKETKKLQFFTFLAKKSIRK